MGHAQRASKSTCLPADALRRNSVKTKSGVTIVELAVVIAIVSVLVGLSLMALGDLKGPAKRKNLAIDLVASLSHAHLRAIARQRTQLIVIDAAWGANRSYGFYHLEDAAAAPNISAVSDLTAILGSLDPSRLSTAPSPYVLRSIDSNYDVNSQYLSSPNAWGTALPFPFGSVPTDTTAGCSFCSAGMGGVAFLPNGHAIFSDGNILGGLIVLQSVAPNRSTSKTGVAISSTGFIEKLVPL